MRISLFVGVATVVLLCACAHPRTDEPGLGLSSLLREPQPGCSGMLDRYCERLYSKAHGGNLEIGALRVRLGRDADSVSLLKFDYGSAISNGRQRLPGDLQASLESLDYFSHLSSFLKSDPGLQRKNSELGQEARWQAALNETVRRRASKELGFEVDPESELLPIELTTVVRLTRKRLLSEVSRAVWGDSRVWIATQAAFERVKARFLDVIRRLPLESRIRRRWVSRIESARVVLPEQLAGPDDGECISSETNAYYDMGSNSVVVCAGEFNGEELTETLAHELGHALDIDTASFQFQQGTSIGRELSDLRQRICGTKPFSCESWSRLKRDFPAQVAELGNFQAELPEFQGCLQGGVPPKKPSEADVARLAELEVSANIANLAGSAIFSGVFSPKRRFEDREVTNPNYLNPCHYGDGSPPEEPQALDVPLNWLLFAVAEFRCHGDFAKAIRKAKTLGVELTRALIRLEGRFSSRTTLVSEGFAVSPSEHFADTLASYVVAEELRGHPSVPDRRAIFLAGSSVACAESLQEASNPIFSAIEQEFAPSAHATGAARSVFRFTRPIRDILMCRDDLPARSCELRLRE